MQVSFAITQSKYGRTLTALEDISRGRVIWKYDQTIPTQTMSLAEIHALPQEQRVVFEMYCWQVDGDAWEGVTENPDEDPLNFIDHSCDPNMAFHGDNQLIALRDIKNHEPLTIEYATCDTVYARLDHCLCGTKQCRGRVTERDAYDPELRKRYAGQMRSCIDRLV